MNFQCPFAAGKCFKESFAYIVRENSREWETKGARGPFLFLHSLSWSLNLLTPADCVPARHLLTATVLLLYISSYSAQESMLFIYNLIFQSLMSSYSQEATCERRLI